MDFRLAAYSCGGSAGIGGLSRDQTAPASLLALAPHSAQGTTTPSICKAERHFVKRHIRI